MSEELKLWECLNRPPFGHVDWGNFTVPSIGPIQLNKRKGNLI